VIGYKTATKTRIRKLADTITAKEPGSGLYISEESSPATIENTGIKKIFIQMLNRKLANIKITMNANAKFIAILFCAIALLPLIN